MNTEMIHQLGAYVAANVLKQPNRVIAPDQPLITSGMVDSFSLVDLALYVEDTYNVHLDDSELNAETFNTLEQLAALIEARAA